MHPSCKQVQSWAEAIKLFTSQNWEDVTLEAANQLTEFLHDKFRAQYQHWSRIADSVKSDFLKDFSDATLLPAQQRWALPVSFIHCVQWDVLHIAMEYKYREYSGRPSFFTSQLLPIYESGHYPCGWAGAWPEGVVVVI